MQPNVPHHPSPTRGLLLVGHGTREPEGTRQFFQLADQVQKTFDEIYFEDGANAATAEGGFEGARLCLERTLVQPCLLEFQRPNIEEGWQRLVDAGVRHIDVSPLLLFSAGHAKQDIPQAIREAASRTPEITVNFARPLSRHPSLVELVVRRISSTLVTAQMDAHGKIELVMIGRGSHDPCARSDMMVLAEIVRHRLGLDSVTPCFYAMCSPRLNDFFVNRPLPNDRCWIFYPHLLFQGKLLDSIATQIEAWSTRYSIKAAHLCEPLGPDPLVARAVIGRAYQACNNPLSTTRFPRVD